MVSIAAAAAGVVLFSPSAVPAQIGPGGTGGGMPLGAGTAFPSSIPPVVRTGRHGEKLTYRFQVTRDRSMVLITVNNKPLMNVAIKNGAYVLSDPNGSALPILTLPAQKR